MHTSLPQNEKPAKNPANRADAGLQRAGCAVALQCASAKWRVTIVLSDMLGDADCLYVEEDYEGAAAMYSDVRARPVLQRRASAGGRGWQRRGGSAGRRWSYGPGRRGRALLPRALPRPSTAGGEAAPGARRHAPRDTTQTPRAGAGPLATPRADRWPALPTCSGLESSPGCRTRPTALTVFVDGLAPRRS